MILELRTIHSGFSKNSSEIVLFNKNAMYRAIKSNGSLYL